MVYTYDITIEVQASIPGSANALTSVNAQILDPTSNTFVNVEVIPATQTWLIYDVFTRSSSDVAVDGQLVFIKNNVKVLFRAPPLSSTLTNVLLVGSSIWAFTGVRATALPGIDA